MHFDVIIIGAGAAGMMCAAQAGARGRRVLLIDHAAKIGERIRISGGGRCNFTNRTVSADNYLSQNPHFCRSALARFTQWDFIVMIEKRGIPYHEREHGQLFCDESAQDIINMLRDACDDVGVKWALECPVRQIEKPGADTAQPTAFAALGLELLEPLKPMAGNTLDAVAMAGDASFRENVLLTHRGLSGPAILQVSSYWQMQAYDGGRQQPVAIDLLPGIDAAAWLNEHRQGRVHLPNLLAEHLPRRFAHEWCALYGGEKAVSRPIGELGRRDLEAIAERLNAWPLMPSGTLGFAKAEVTLGGVSTDALSSKTMAAKAVPGLYFIGEVVDVTGWLGGYNFQWAWSSGWVAGQFV